jgi:hypothetical protein
LIFVCKLGPLMFDEGPPRHVLLPASEDELLEPIIVERVAEGLSAIAARHRSGQLRCEASLGKPGKKLGFKVAPAPPWALFAKSMLALHLTWTTVEDQGDGSAMRPDPQRELAQASADFCAAAPWRYFGDEFPVQVKIDGVHFEASILGAAGIEMGLALHPGGEGALERALVRINLGEMDFDSLAVTFDEEPAFAAAALRESLPAILGVPVPISTSARGPRLPEGREIIQLCAALGAVAKLSPRVRSARHRLEVGSTSCEAVAEF